MIPMAMAYGDSGKSMQGLALVDVGGFDCIHRSGFADAARILSLNERTKEKEGAQLRLTEKGFDFERRSG